MHDRASVPEGINKLIELAQHLVPGMHGVDDGSDVASEVSENTESFDVGAWGANMFSLDEMREELERLREESDSGGRRSTFANEAGSSLCSLPAMVCYRCSTLTPPGAAVEQSGSILRRTGW